MKKLFISLFVILLTSSAYTQPNTNCSGAAPFCSENQYSFPMNTGAPDAEEGPDYGCLGSEPNPAWYFMQIEQGGDLSIFMASQQNEDVDFICYGPFASLNNVCDNLTAGTIVDCSYSPNPTETCNIPNAQPGEIYLLLLTNFSDNFSIVNFSQTNNGQPGAGSTDCSILSVDAGLCLGDTLFLEADFQDSSSYTWSGPNGFNSTLEDTFIPNITFSDTGQYVCIIMDTINSIADTLIVSVHINPAPTATFSLPIACELQNGNFGIVAPNVTIIGYHWDFGTTATNDTSNIASPQFYYPTIGNYIITLDLISTDGCTNTIDTSIFVHSKPQALLATSPICEGSVATFTPTVTADTTVQYNWTFPGGTPSSSTNSQPSTVFNTSGNINVQLTLTSDFGCVNTFNYPLLVRTSPNASMGVYPICISRFTFDPFGIGDTAWVVDWYMGDGTTFLDRDTSYFNYIYNQSGTYYPLMVVTDLNGCIDSVIQQVDVLDTLTLHMPNVLVHSSTMGNNKFDMEVIKPKFNLCVEYTFTIFDRWGVIVYEAYNDPYHPDLYCNDCFTGKTEGGKELAPGVYYYLLKGAYHLQDHGFITIFD